MSEDIRERVRFYMTQTTRLLQAKQEGVRYLGESPIIDGQQAITDGESLLDSDDLRLNQRQYENVSRRHAKIVEEFGRLQATSTVA
jgi:hypothetical protein